MGVDGDDPCQVTSPVSVGQSVSGQLNASDCAQPDGAYSDRWSLSLSGQTDVRMDLTSSDFDADQEIRDNLGNVIATNRDADASLNSRIIQTLQAGSARGLVRDQLHGNNGDQRPPRECQRRLWSLPHSAGKNGIDIATGWDEMGDGNAWIRESLSPGSYALLVASPSFPCLGSYRVTLCEVTCDDPASARYSANSGNSGGR